MELSTVVKDIPAINRANTPTDQDYRTHAAFRYALRQFLRVSERHARAAGVTPQQHLLLLAVRGHPSYPKVTITEVAEYLQSRHNGASLLIERAVQRDLLVRDEDPADGRRTLVSLTRKGERVLAQITIANRAELRTSDGAVPRLDALMEEILNG